MAKEEILEMAEVSRTNKFKQSAKLVSIVISSFPSRSNIKTRAQIFSEADLDGLHDFIDAESTCLRTFWASVLVLATICASYMSWLFISNALEQPTVSKMEFVVPKDLRYPTVTVCDHRGSRLLNKTKLQLDGISDNSVQLMLLSGPIWLLAYDDFPNISIFDDSVATGFLLAYQQEFGNPAEMLRKFFLTYGAPCDSLFHSCRDANWDRLDCCQMFFPIIHARHGLCYASDPEKMPKISAPGLFSNFFLKFRKPENLWSIRGAAKNNSEEAVFTLDISIDTGIDQGVWRADYLTVEFGFWSTVNLGFKHIKAEPSAAIACEQDPQLSYFQVI